MSQAIDYHAILPELVLAGTLLAVVMVDAFLRPARAWVAMPVSTAGVLAALVAALTLVGEERSAFGGMFVVDDFAVLFKVFFLAVAVVVLAVSARYFREGRYYQGEYYYLLLTAVLGSLLMPSSRDLLMLFLSLELVSAPAFLITAFRKGDLRSTEAGVKFFLIGVLSTAVMLYGMSLVYGVTGRTRLAEVAVALAGVPAGQQTLVLAAILLVVTGFAFKVSAVPFQFWAPDTYEGAPVPVAAFLGVASQAAGFAGLLQLMFQAFPGQADFWAPVFAALSVASMTVGNLIALQQRHAVRLLAYSGIAQSGYILVPFAVAGGSAATDERAFAATVTYILIYAIMNLGAYAVVVAVSRERPTLLFTDFAGLMRRAPLLGAGMTLFMVSLAGVPPTGGFWAKFFVFTVAIERGGIGPWLAAVMVVNSVISLFYYLAIPRQMIFEEGEERPLSPPALVSAVVAVALVAIVAVFVFPDLLARVPQGATLVAP